MTAKVRLAGIAVSSNANHQRHFTPAQTAITPRLRRPRGHIPSVHLPWTFFHWLNVTPRVGGRVTYYSARTSQRSAQQRRDREVFNTGVGTSIQSVAACGRTPPTGFCRWTGCGTSSSRRRTMFLCPTPARRRRKLPQFDGEQPSLMVLPVHVSRLQQH